MPSVSGTPAGTPDVNVGAPTPPAFDGFGARRMEAALPSACRQDQPYSAFATPIGQETPVPPMPQ